MIRNTIRVFCRCDRGATGFGNGMIAVLTVLAAITLFGQVGDSIRSVFHNSAVQADTDWEYGRR